MEWIKRNIPFVLCGVAALILAGVAVWLLLGKMQQDTQVQEELNQLVQEATRIHTAPAFPNQENIAAAKAEQERLKEFRQRLAKHFSPAPEFKSTSDQQFKAYLENTIAGLTARAGSANVALPPRFSFTFTSHRTQFQFAPGSIEPWMMQLEDIQSLCGILFQSRVNALDNLQRVPVSLNDSGAAEFLSASITTNQLGVFVPYSVSFRCFSAELASVMERMARSTNFILVKNVSVTPSTVPLPTASVAAPAASAPAYVAPAYTPPAYQPPSTAGKGGLAELESRYGIVAEGPVRRGPSPAPAYTPPAYTPPTAVRQAAPTATTLLTERPLQVTILLDMVKLNPMP